MALVSAVLSPHDDVRTMDFLGTNGRVAGFEVDGITVYLGTFADAADKDAAIVASANLLIGVLVGLRDPAVRRIAETALVNESAPGELVEAYGK